MLDVATCTPVQVEDPLWRLDVLHPRRSSRWSSVIAVVGSAAVLALYAAVADPLRTFLVTAGFILVVLASGLLGGWKPSLLATGLCILGYLFIFVEPAYSFRISDARNPLILLGYLVVGVAIGALCEGLHLAGARLEERQRHLEQEIADHRQAQHDLQVAEQKARTESERSQEVATRLRVTLASIGDAVITTDAQGRVTYLNAIAESLTGWKLSDAQSRPLSDVFPIVNERTRAVVESPCDQVLATGAKVGLANHTVLIDRDGTETPIDDSAAPILDDAGTVLGVVLVFRDATQERRATDALRRLAAIVESSADAIIGKTIDGVITTWNEGANSLYGYTAEEVIGRNIDIIMPSEKKDELARILERLKLGARIEQFDTVRQRKDGSLVNVSLQVSPISDTYGEIVGASAVARDITERKRTEQALAFLAQTSRNLGALTDRTSALQRATRLMVPFFADWCIIYAVTDEGGIQSAAYAHRDSEKEQLLKELLDRHPIDWNTDMATVRALRTGKAQLDAKLPPDRLSRIAHTAEDLARIQSLEPRSVISAPLQIRSRTVATITFVASDSRPRYTAEDLALAEDLAYRVATAIENAELFESVRAADRQKDEFLAMLAHELRNPLAAIKYANSLMQVSDANAHPEWIEIVDRQVNNLTQMIDDLLDVSRIGRGKIQLRKIRMDAGAIVRRAADAVRPLIEEKRHELVLDVHAEKMPIIADATRVEQIIANLLTNAAKYTPDGGRINVTASPQAEQVVVTVKDTGVGLSPESLARVFELFSQADQSLDRAQGGLGIGLTVAGKLAQMHGGTVTAASEGPSRGSEFTLRLPLTELATDSDIRNAEEAATKHDGPHTKLRILVVDDNHDTARMETWLLSQLGHEVATAHDGLEALQLAESFRPDTILLDIGLPQIDGYEVARRLRAQGFDTGVLIAVSGYGRADDVQRSREAGFDHHLVKPVDLESLTSLLDGIQPGADGRAGRSDDGDVRPLND